LNAAHQGCDWDKENIMTSNTTPALWRRITATAIGASAIAVGAMALAPGAQADTFQHHCTTAPQDYATGAVLGVYSTQKVGVDRYEICKMYDANNKLLGTMNVPNYGYYNRKAQLPPGADQVKLG
jgi:hypothetical protein